MPTVAPEVSFEAVAQFTTGLTGTLGVRIIDNVGNTTLARQTANIAEYPAGTGIYEITLTAPAVAGQYTLIWDDGGTGFAVDELVVTYSAPAGLTGTLYVTPAELKSSLSLQNQTYANDDIDMACTAASRAIDQACGRWFYSATETRYYTGGYCDDTLFTDDIISITSLSVDGTGNGSFGTTWTENTDFFLLPFNNSLQSKPFEYLKINSKSGKRFPNSIRNVKISGVFGWGSIPSEVRQYAKIFANKLLLRSRQAPFGVLSYGMDQPIAVRIARHDPDFEKMLGHLVKVRHFI